MPYDLIAISVILAILGGCIALAISATKSAAIAEDDLEEAGQELKHVAGLMEKTEDALRNRPRTLNDALDRL